MNKEKWKELFGRIRKRLSFLRLSVEEAWEDTSDEEQTEETEPEETRSEEKQQTQPEEAAGTVRFEDVLTGIRRRRLLFFAVLILLIAVILFGYYLYNRTHSFTDYILTKSIENTMTSGTQYEEAGQYLYRYNTDGVSCVTRKNEVRWSITYSMQAPIVDVCGTTMVIAEQQGTQIYVINEDGLVGNFTSLLPILKVRVSNQGLVAVVLQDDDVTWINLYDAQGETIASDKTTIADSGYPLDVALSPNGEKMAVSYLGITDGAMTSDIVFYDFSAEGNADEDYVMNRESLAGTAAPEVYFVDNTTAVVVADEGFLVYRGSKMTRSAECWFDEEIVSCFYSDDTIGFLFQDTGGEALYRMELYNYQAKKKVTAPIDTEFTSIKVQNNKIILYSSSDCSVYTTGGKLQYSSPYEKEIVDIFYFDEFRRYLIITQDSFDRIRIC